MYYAFTSHVSGINLPCVGLSSH